MEINPDIYDVLKEYKIDKNQGTLALLAIWFKLDAETTCSEEVIKAINLTKIVEKVHANGTLQWNMPLFTGQQTEWDWVETEYNVLWKRNQDRKASNPDCKKRMQDFFKKYPIYRKDDVMKAVRAYHAATKDAGFLKNSAAFIFDGQGAMKKSILLGWCEKTINASSVSNLKGTIIK
jgi:hypothetical protein